MFYYRSSVSNRRSQQQKEVILEEERRFAQQDAAGEEHKRFSMRATAYLSTDSEPVAICFEDKSITILFARLLDSMGVPIRLLNEITELEDGAKVITEPQFYSKLRAQNKKDSLVIGQAQAVDQVEGVGLSQPLTEEKIEVALARFLAPPVH